MQVAKTCIGVNFFYRRTTLTLQALYSDEKIFVFVFVTMVFYLHSSDLEGKNDRGVRGKASVGQRAL